MINNQSTRKEVPRPALRGEGEVKTRHGGAQGKGGRRSQFNPLLLTFWFLPLVCQVRTKRGYRDFFKCFKIFEILENLKIFRNFRKSYEISENLEMQRKDVY